MKRTIKTIIAIAILLLSYSIFTKVDAASATIGVDKTNATVGDTITISVSMDAAAWNTNVSGAVSKNFAGNSDDGENTRKTETVTFTPSKAGSYTFNLGGDVSDGSTNATTNVSGSITVVVEEKGGNSNSNNNNNTPEPTFKKVNDTVYSTGDINVRKSYSTDSSVVGSLKEGEEIKREGVGDNGWSKVVYNGATAYIKTSLLTTEKPKEKSADKALKSLTVTPEGLDPVFNPETTSYKLDVGADVEKIEVKAVANDEKAKVEVSGNEGLKEGENTVKIVVTAEDETARTYTITVTKKKKSAMVLKTLSVKGFTLNPAFSPEVYVYKLELTDASVTKLDITANTDIQDAEVKISGNENFKKGQNIVSISVKSKDGKDETVYKIYVNKTADSKSAAGTTNKKNDNKKSKLPLFIGIGAILALIIAIIAIIIKHKRDSEYYDEEEMEDEDGNDMYGYAPRNNKDFGDDFIPNINPKSENRVDEPTKIVKPAKDEDDDFANLNPYATKNLYGDFNEKKPNNDPNKDLFGTMNGVDESYNYSNTNDNLTDALNDYKQQEQQDFTNKPQNSENNFNQFSENDHFNNKAYESFFNNGQYDDDDEYKSRRPRGKHSK